VCITEKWIKGRFTIRIPRSSTASIPSSSTYNYQSVNINIGYLKSVPGYLKFAELVSYIPIDEKEVAINSLRVSRYLPNTIST
jgi:hypothetical protein